jgi:hypothetical protein
VVLIVAGTSKLTNISQFAHIVKRFRLVPSLAVRPVSTAIPVAEVVIGASLPLGLILKDRVFAWSGAPAASLFALFGLAVMTNILRGNIDISCGCFGSRNTDKLTWGIVARAYGLLAASIMTLPWYEGADVATPTRIGVLVSISALAGVWLIQQLRMASPNDFSTDHENHQRSLPEGG